MYIEERVRKRTDESKEVTWREYDCFLKMLDKLENADKELFNKYVVAPAASRHHGAYKCGLVDHSLNVAVNLLEWRAQHLDCGLTKEECIFLGMFHDLCKVDTYILNDDGTITYDKELIKHHALRTVELCKKFGWKLDTKCKVMILLHMSSWENEEDLKALTLRDRLWLMNPKHVQLVQAMNWADMAAAKREELAIANEKK